MIEAGTYIIAVLVCGGRINLRNATVSDLDCFLSFLRRIGADIEIKENEITITASPLSAFDITTEPYPGFPTDLHPQCAALASVCNGKSSITETVFKNRFAYLQQLSKLGLKYIRTDDRVEIFGNTPFKCGKADSTDLRGGASLLIAALSAKGESIIGNSEFIERGYSDVVLKLSKLGADIRKI
jgi:UDP-N-acetylglucosamine 1-carboxyvinyltransferase